MSTTIGFISDATAKTATLLTRNADSQVLILKSEHSDKKPSTVLLRRRLAGLTGTVRRSYCTRTVYVDIDAGTDQERVAPIVVKIEFSIPVGAADADVIAIRDDMTGLVASEEFTELNTFGILPNA